MIKLKCKRTVTLTSLIPITPTHTTCYLCTHNDNNKKTRSVRAHALKEIMRESDDSKR